MPRRPLQTERRRRRNSERRRSRASRYFRQLSCVGLDNKESLLGPRLLCPFAVSCDGDHAAGWLQKILRALQGLAADRIKDHINITSAVFETFLTVVDHLVSSELGEELKVPCRGGGNYVRAGSSSELNREKTDRARSAVHEDALTPAQFRSIEQSLPRSEGANRDARGLQMT
jgi:hypothetical protein